jgi:hypothetical protein
MWLLWELVTANVVLCSPILVTLMKEVLISSEMSVLTKATPRNNPEDTILHFPNSYPRPIPWECAASSVQGRQATSVAPGTALFPNQLVHQ